jgi:hypothetical protein
MYYLCNPSELSVLVRLQNVIKARLLKYLSIFPQSQSLRSSISSEQYISVGGSISTNRKEMGRGNHLH